MIPDNVVVAGNPAKIIRTLDEHLSIRLRKYQNEAFLYYNSFLKHYNREPSIREMGPFFPLFIERDKGILQDSGVNISPNGDDSEDLVSCLLKSKPQFNSFEQFKKYAKDNE